MYIKNADQLFTLDSNMTFGISSEYHKLIEDLGDFDLQKRTDALIILRHLLDSGEIASPVRTNDTNNHVHTWYSFSPYTPTMAIWMATMSGLCTVGIVDHDSVGGAHEFIQAGEIMRITTTIGAEVRTSFEGTIMEGRSINSPDEHTVGYVAVHGIPHNRIEMLDEILLADIRHSRNVRTAVETWNARSLLPQRDLRPDFWNEVIDYSLYCFGNGKITKNRNLMSGSATERHLLFAIAKRMITKYGKGAELIRALQEGLQITLPQKSIQVLMDTDYPHYEYDLINILKGDFIPKIYHSSFGDNELPPDSLPVGKVVQKIRSTGGIPSYCYLGDVGESPTGDKKAQKFEDEYLDELFPLLKDLGFEAIAYMPTRNTMQQLQRVMALCDKYEFIQISGEDINQPRQKFVCEKLREPAFAHLTDATWALVGHEEACALDMDDGIYSQKTKKAFPNLKQRIAHFRDIGLKLRKE
ncbi:MAG: PHP domain-containing protein [Eubacteriales bacterium]